MNRSNMRWMWVLMLALAAGAAWTVPVQADEAPGKAKAKGVWTDPKDASLPADYAVQGEYVGEIKGGDKLGAQVIALSDGAFQVVIYPGGLPGAGWDGKSKILLSGMTEGGKTAFTPAEGPRKYLAQKPEQFSATSKFPPEGQKPYTAEIAAGGEAMTGKTDDGKAFELKKTVRQSPTLGAKPPAGAVVLFDGTSADAWKGGRVDEKTHYLNTDGSDITTTQQFKDYTMHVEFLLPFKPDGRGQGRGNSGFYQADLYEVQVLDSFGLEGKDNECGGVYTRLAPSVNMCLPPLVWQTYDVDFTSAKTDSEGKKTANARITLKHNGVTVHDKAEITGKTGGARAGAEGTPGPIKLQGHGNPLQYRNIWIVEKGAKPEGVKSGGAKNDGAKNDGVKNDGVKNNGEKNDGVKNEGAKNDGAKNDGAKNDGAKNDGANNDGDNDAGAKAKARK